MVKRLLDTLGNERGMVLVVAVLMLMVVTIIGIAALTTSDTELHISANEKLLAGQFYEAEAGLVEAMERRPKWMTDDFLMAGEIVANFISDNATDVGNCDPAVPTTWILGDFDADCNPDLRVEIRNIEDTGTAIGGLSTEANNLPPQPHVGPPPIGSGYSVKYFEVRRYGITTTSQNGNTQVQAGAYVVFNKF